MIEKYKLTEEANQIIKYINEHLVKEYPTDNVIIEYFMLSVLENEETIAYQILSKTMLNLSIEVMHKWYVKFLTDNNNIKLLDGDKVKYDTFYEKCFKNALSGKNKEYKLNSGDILLSIIKMNKTVKDSFSVVGVTYEQIKANLNEISATNSEDDSLRNEIEEKTVVDNSIGRKSQPSRRKTNKYPENSEVEKHLVNINKLSDSGKITRNIGNEDIINTIFNIFLKKSKNNVIVVGDSGVGKTSMVKHIANMINEHNVPKPFRDKQLVELNFMSLVSNTGFKGVFENKLKSIIEDARKRGCYIFFVDDIHSILSENSRFGEVNMDKMLTEILDDNNIQFICTTSHKGYNNYIAKNPLLKRQFEKIVLNEPDEQQMVDILKYHSEVLGKYHNVSYNEDCIKSCLTLSKRYITEFKLPDSAIDVLDETGAIVSLTRKENSEIKELEDELLKIEYEKNELKNSNHCDYDKTDELTKKEIKIKSKINNLEKNDLLKNNEPLIVTLEDIKDTISSKTSIPVTELNDKEKEILKNINSNIKNVVVGQDEAVDAVCKVVKRQRIGISSPNKPSVLFFAGCTGTGKTYLAKCIAKEVFGDEKNMVRLDMSEYVEKMSVNKLYGSAAGYIGYDNGGILTNAIKKNKYCVLLLDEIEKANEDVHNVFLQLFDEGRLTDNLGEVVDFKNVIIIMTSNIGAKAAAERGRKIGFSENNDISKEIINKEIKSKFKPEFLNRIDKIVYFNKLSEENIKEIIRLEIIKLKKRIEEIGYNFDESMVGDKIVDMIYDRIGTNHDFGARPVIREIQKNIEDRITDYIIDNNIEKGFTFSYNMLF